MRTHLGMHALGRLDPATTVALQAHLDGCARCREELRDLREVSGSLGLADPDRIPDRSADPPSTLHDAIFGAVDEDRRRQQRRRVTLLAATTAATAAAVVVAFTVVLGSVVGGGAGSPESTGRQVAFTAQPAGVAAAAIVESRNFGTSVALDVTGLTKGQRYAVWLARPDGSRMAAGSFIAGGDKTMSMQLAVGLPMSEASALGVSTPTDRVPILLAPLHT